MRKTDTLKNEAFTDKLKVILINPPQTIYKGSPSISKYFPIGLMQIAAMIRNLCSVEIVDCLAAEYETERNNITYYGSPPEEIRKTIKEKKPQVVGVSVPFTTQYKNAELVALICKELNPKAIVVFGGPDPSVRFKTILKNQYCDYCVIGEGEQTFYEFIKSLSLHQSIKNIKGLAYKHGSIICYEPRTFVTDLDIYPFPAFDLINVDKYLQSKYLYQNRGSLGQTSISIITSRGCPYNCVFCSVKLHMGQKYRTHSPEYVMKLLHLCIDKYGITNFHFEDDNLSFDRQRFETILDCIIRENLNIQWDAPNGLRTSTLDYSILKKMKQSGCVNVAIAIESGSQRVLDEVIHKKSNLEHAIEIVRKCKELRIRAHAFYVIGFPGETITEMKETTHLAIKLYRDYDLVPDLMVATPLYGTELYEICMRDKLIKREPSYGELAIAQQTWGNPMISTPDFSEDDIKQVINEYNKRLFKQRLRYRISHPRKIARDFTQRFLRQKR